MTRRSVMMLLLLLLACALAAQERKATGAADGQFQIRGTVVDGDNDLPLASTHVTITAAQGGAAQTMMTGADGAFWFDHVRAGKYMLSAERRGFASQQFQEHDGQFSTAIVVGPGLESGNIVFRALPDASFSGRVSDEQGEMVRSARVMLIHEQMAEGMPRKLIVANAVTNDQGFYHFAHLRPGAYYIAVSARPWYAEGPFLERMGFGFGARGRIGGGNAGASSPANPALDVAYPLTFYPDVTDSATARAITLRAGDRASADFTLRVLQALHVSINVGEGSEDRDEQRGFSARLAHTVFDGLEIPIPTVSVGGGRGRLVMVGVPPGRYLLRVNEGRSRPQDGPEDNPQSGRVRELDLVSDTEVDASEIPAAAAASGIVKTADGRLLPKPAQLQLRSRGMRTTMATRATEKGEFTFARGVPAGSYEITMDGGENTFIQSVSATGAKVMGRTVEISGSDAVHLSVVANSGMAKVEGVAMRDGKPQAGVMILLVPNDPANHLPLFRRDQSDSDGSFTLANVIPGRYTLLALEKGWDLSWSDAEALKPFLAGGEALVAQRKGTYNLRVNVQ